MPWALILDGLLAVLLVLMICYAFVLNRRLSTLRTDREDLEAFISRFNEATNRANASLQGLRGAAESNAALIKNAADKAQALRDELAFLVERADGSAERLAKASARPDGAGASSAGTKEAGAAEQPASEDDTAKPTRAKPRTVARERPVSRGPEGTGADTESEAERELLNALRRAR